MFCYKCGTQLPNGAEFCFKCGTKIPMQTDVEAPVETAAETAAETPVEQQSQQMQASRLNQQQIQPYLLKIS